MDEMYKKQLLESLMRAPSSAGMNLANQYGQKAYDARQDYLASLLNQGVNERKAQALAGRMANPMIAIPIYEETSKLPVQYQVEQYNKETARPKTYIAPSEDRSWELQQYLESLKPGQIPT